MKYSKPSPVKCNAVAVDGKRRQNEDLHMMNNSYEKAVSTKYPPTKVYWGLVVFYTAIHIGAIYGLQLCFKTAKSATLIWGKCFLPM